MGDATLVLEWRLGRGNSNAMCAEVCGFDLYAHTTGDWEIWRKTRRHAESILPATTRTNAQHAAERACGALLDTETIRALVAKSRTAP